MSTTMKVLLTTGGFFVLCVGVVGFKAYSWWQTNGKTFVAAIRTSTEDGRTFGRTSDNAGCIKSALDRFGSDSTTLGTLQAVAYSQTCLKESKPSTGFCDGVPQPNERSAASEWARTKCDGMAMVNPRTCRVVMGPVPRYCHPANESSS